MLRDLDPKTRAAALRLTGNPDFERWRAWLAEERNELAHLLIQGNTDPGVLRGACRVLDAIEEQLASGQAAPPPTQGISF